MIKHNTVSKYIIDLPIYLSFYLQVYTVNNAFEFEYMDLPVRIIQQCDLKNDIKRLSS